MGAISVLAKIRERDHSMEVRAIAISSSKSPHNQR
jgi:hypothetical protein